MTVSEAIMFLKAIEERGYGEAPLLTYSELSVYSDGLTHSSLRFVDGTETRQYPYVELFDCSPA